MKFPILYLLTALLLVTVIVSCDDDDPEPENPEELITTLNLYFTEDGTSNQVVQTFRDIDGDGGMEPVITTSPLDANTNYDLRVEVLNEAETPTEDITEEVLEEDDEHQFFFVTSSLNLDISYADSDGDGNPLGVENTAVTGAADNGTLTVILRHEPDKSGEGVAGGDPTNAGGETDIEVTFSIEIE